MKVKNVLGLSLLCLSLSAYASLKTGDTLGEVKLSGEQGSTVAGKEFDSSKLKDKVHVLFYVDPDESETNEHVGEAIKAKKYSKQLYKSVGIINMDATWLPNFAIDSKLEAKQAKYKDVLYVRDLDKVLVKAWGLKDDSSNVIVLDKEGKVVFYSPGRVSDKDVAKLLQIMEREMRRI